MPVNSRKFIDLLDIIRVVTGIWHFVVFKDILIRLIGSHYIRGFSVFIGEEIFLQKGNADFFFFRHEDCTSS